MTRRLFYIALGATVGVLVVRKATRAADRFTPAGVQRGVTGALAGVADAIRDFGDEVRAGMAERETELRRELGLDGSHDVVDTP
ncbi:MAG: hypothetical protein JWM02_359 [Frankiales bacterium]|nr:hypothetical protein [Frankiales bacterium]